MTSYLKTYISILISFISVITFAQNQDCITAFDICGNYQFSFQPISGFGDVEDLSIDYRGCLDNGENNSTWFKFAITQGGELTLDIIPDAPADYDFSIFRLVSRSQFYNCTDIFSGNLQDVRCNFSGISQGTTGLRTGFTNVSSTPSMPEFSAPISVFSGEVYVMVVDKFSSGQVGYTIDFSSSTAKISCLPFVNGSDTIQGNVFIDDNGNCIKDSSDQSVPNVIVTLPPIGAVLTDSLGDYSIVIDTGSYSIGVASYHNNVRVSCPANGIHNINFNARGQKISGVDFGVEVTPIQDLYSSIYCGVIRPGFTQNISFTVKNHGTVSMTGVAKFELGTPLNFLSVTGGTPAPDSIDFVSNTIYWNFDTLKMFETITFNFRAEVPPVPSIALGDLVSHKVIVSPVNGDNTVENNTDYCNTVVRGAFDPNDKTVSPSGEGQEGNITQQDTLMHYRIRFQNTGNDTAFTVIIRDTLDANLDWSSFRKGTSSHPYQVHFEKENILVFTFNNILLPDNNVNLARSQGHVTFYMEHNGVLPLGTIIENRAAIYFDYNPAIITNTVRNKIYKPVGIEELSSLKVNLYPNPTDNQIIIDASNENIQRLIVTDISGKQLMDVQSINTQKHQLNLDIEAGIYLVQVYTAKGAVTKKMVVR